VDERSLPISGWFEPKLDCAAVAGELRWE
jgi:hypothetical protein